jgi:hypothetical protein
MSADRNFVGVRQPAFDTMVGGHIRAAAQADRLARALWAELSRAQLDTSPAVRIREIAGRLREQAADLQRRQRLVHEMERQKIEFGFRTSRGTFWSLPDRVEPLRARLDGAEAAELARKAASGDRNALRRLTMLAAEADDPEFARSLLARLGADGVIALPAALAWRLRKDMDGRDPALGRDEAGVRSALKMFSKALALGTDPASGGYAGDPFLDRLKDLGRAEHSFPEGRSGDTYVGHQSLATLLAMGDGRPPFSARFMRTVGSDMVAYDREHRPVGPLPRKPPPVVFPYVPGLPHRRQGTAPLPDLTGLLHLGWALTPAGDRPTVEPPSHGRTDFLTGLMRAAGFSKRGAQALLDHTASGQKSSDLDYLLHERRGLWAYTDHGSGLGQALRAATAGHGAISQRLFKETSEILGRDTRRYFTYDKDHRLKFTDTDGHADDLSGLRPSLGEVLRVHLGDVSDSLFGEMLGSGPPKSLPSPRDIDALLVEVGQDDAAFSALVRDGIGRTRMLLDRQYADGNGIDNVLISQGGLLGHLLAMRREALISRGVRTDAANQQVKDMIGNGVGLLPVPYAKLFAGIPAGVYSGLVEHQYDKIGEWLWQQIREDGGSAQQDSKSITDEQAVMKLLRQMSLSAAIGHAAGAKASGEPFADANGRIRPPNEWVNDSRAESRFVQWCERNDFVAPQMSESLRTAIKNSHDDAVASFNQAEGP